MCRRLPTRPIVTGHAIVTQVGSQSARSRPRTFCLFAPAHPKKKKEEKLACQYVERERHAERGMAGRFVTLAHTWTCHRRDIGPLMILNHRLTLGNGGVLYSSWADDHDISSVLPASGKRKAGLRITLTPRAGNSFEHERIAVGHVCNIPRIQPERELNYGRRFSEPLT